MHRTHSHEVGKNQSQSCCVSLVHGVALIEDKLAEDIRRVVVRRDAGWIPYKGCHFERGEKSQFFIRPLCLFKPLAQTTSSVRTLGLITDRGDLARTEQVALDLFIVTPLQSTQLHCSTLANAMKRSLISLTVVVVVVTDAP